LERGLKKIDQYEQACCQPDKTDGG
jgi:hypothetical protein